MQDQPLRDALWCFEERLPRSGLVSRAGVSVRREPGWVLPGWECTAMAFPGMTASCKHVFTPNNLLTYLSVIVHTESWGVLFVVFFFFPFPSNLKPRLCKVRMSRVRLKTKRCMTLTGPPAFFFSSLFYSLCEICCFPLFC